MARTTFNIPNTPLPLGESVFGPFNVPAGIATIELHFDPTQQFNNTGGFQLLAELTLESSVDGGASWQLRGGTGLFSDPAFVDPKRGGTDAMTRWGPMPSPCQVRLRAQAIVACTLTGASIAVS